MIIDPRKPATEVRYRFETFCYGPKARALGFVIMVFVIFFPRGLAGFGTSA
jgi:hypothetical protein